MSETKACFLYVVECQDKTFYTGISFDVKQRIKLHNAGRGAAYTASRRPVRLVAIWQFISRSDALRAEFAFKKLSRQSKMSFIFQHLPFHGAPFVSVN